MNKFQIAAFYPDVRRRFFVWLWVIGCCLGVAAAPADGRLFDHLRALSGGRFAVGDPSKELLGSSVSGVEGPKDVAVGDVDGDGKMDFAASNKDGTVTLYFGKGDGGFDAPVHLQTWLDSPLDLHGLTHTNYLTNSCIYVSTNLWYENEVLHTNWATICVPVPETVAMQVISLSDGPVGLRGLAIGAFAGNRRRDIAVASPGEGLIYLFENRGGRDFAPASRIEAWIGVRDLAAGDFDGDGRMDLVAAGTTNGLVQYRSLGGGQFEKMTNIAWLGVPGLKEDFPQPAFYLKSFRPARSARDVIVMGRAQGGQVTLVEADDGGRMRVGAVLTNVTVHALDVGPLLGPVSGGIQDLVSVDHDDQLLEIRSGVEGVERFATNVVQKLSIPGRAHGVAIVDVDGDGWNDLVVVLQAFSKVRVFRNNHGIFDPQDEVAVGAGPRELAVGDFNGDGLGDVVVLNRRSMDASVLLSNPKGFGFSAIDMVYPTDGEVVSLQVYDFNGDGLDDVVQLHRGAGEISVRLGRPGGDLSEPVFFSMGTTPSDARSVDLNRDGRMDVLVVDLGGGVVARLGNGDGTFGPELRTELKDLENRGRSSSLFSLTTGDFDGDGFPDIAAGFMDCRVGFFRGLGNGRFEHTHTHLLGYETHGLGTGDFDGDGDLDLVASPWDGSLIVVKNPGDLLRAPVLDRTFVTNLVSNSGAWTVIVTDQNHDGDLDVLVDGNGMYTLYLGGPGVGFVPQTNLVDLKKSMPATTLVTADFDRDGIADIIAGCQTGGCVSVSLGKPDGSYAAPFAIPVPSSRLLATGDIDGDGFPDLIGSGEVLWTALSGREPKKDGPKKGGGQRLASDGVFINEVLAANDSIPLVPDGGRFSDFVEIYNGGEIPRPLQGWKLSLVRTNSQGGWITNEYKFPDKGIVDVKGHLVLICSERTKTVYHTGFVLPAEGAMLNLIRPDGSLADRLNYPEQPSNRSFARFQDGVNGFVVTQTPTPGASNTDNGLVGPRVTLEGIDLSRWVPGVPIRFFARGKDDVGIVNVSLLWRRLDFPDTETKRIILYDDGLHGDGGSQDGLFSGEMPEGLGLGAEFQFYLECTDLSGEVDTAPAGPRFVKPGERPLVYTLAVGAPRADVEISEIVARNLNSFRDENGNSPDWIEIRNPTDKAVSLEGFSLAKELVGAGPELVFTNTRVLKPGEHWVIYMDGKPQFGEFHAPFKLDADGGQLVLIGRSRNGARLLLDSVRYGVQMPDIALARLGRGGPWVAGAPTPGRGNVGGSLRGLLLGNECLMVYPTEIGRTYTVEFKEDLSADVWRVMRQVRGMGYEQTVTSSAGERRFFRVREE